MGSKSIAEINDNLSADVRKRFTTGMPFFRDMGSVVDYLNRAALNAAKTRK